jgi:PAS domain S-box-containing protein
MLNKVSSMASLSNSELEMFHFFEMTPDLVCIAGKDGFFKKVNRSVINKFEYTEAELFARPIFSFMHPEDRDATGRKRTELLNGSALINFQNRYITKRNKIIWLDWTSIYLPEKEVVFAIAKDVTERKQKEKEIEEKYKKFKGLAAHFKTSIEKDKKYLAIELHEELAQLAAVVKMDIDWINNNTPVPSATFKRRIDHALVVSNLLVTTIRRISYSISPNMLDDFGLYETLKWLCDEFTILNGIPCLLESTYDTENLPHEIQLDFFRICQESLNNVRQHAQAGMVKINIDKIGDKICLSITDDGQGFEIEQQKQTAGLTSMRERAHSINGQLTIKTEIGRGTEVCFTIAHQVEDRD